MCFAQGRGPRHSPTPSGDAGCRLPHPLRAPSRTSQQLSIAAAAAAAPAGPTEKGIWYSYLIDAILLVPRTRQMYLRRLRTLMDELMATGHLEARLPAPRPSSGAWAQRPAGGHPCACLSERAGRPTAPQRIMAETYENIKAEAERDNAKWGAQGDAERGYRRGRRRRRLPLRMSLRRLLPQAASGRAAQKVDRSPG